MPDNSFSNSGSINRSGSAIHAFMNTEPSFEVPLPPQTTNTPWKEPWLLKPSGWDVDEPRFTINRPTTFHAEPLSPLRQRDEQAIAELFADDQMDEIFNDICSRLKQLYPEPCWEETSFDFLQGYV